MKIAILVALLVVGASAPSQAEENPFAWPGHHRTADWMSTAFVAAQLTADVYHAGAGDRPGHALGCLALRTGATVGAAELTKAVIIRMRPDGSNRHSFYSEHTALAMQSAGWRLQIGIPIAIGTGYLRIAANRHYFSDVAVGALAGLLTRRIC